MPRSSALTLSTDRQVRYAKARGTMRAEFRIKGAPNLVLRGHAEGGKDLGVPLSEPFEWETMQTLAGELPRKAIARRVTLHFLEGRNNRRSMLFAIAAYPAGLKCK